MSKALIINPYWNTMGGGERYAAAMARLLLVSGWQVDLDWPDPSLIVHIQNNFGIDLSACGLAYKAMTAGYDLSFWVSDGSLPSSFSKKTVVHFQFPFQNVHGKSLINLIKSKFYIFVVNSAFTKKFIDREFGINSTIIYPPVDTDKFLPGNKRNLILYVGRFSQLTQKKGQEILIESFRHISSKIPGWELVLAGGTLVGVHPSHLTRLQKSIRGLNIKIITNPKLNQLQKLYSQAKIFWSGSGFGIAEDLEPTRVEHFGISVVEAMSAGAVPIIAGFGGHREIVEPDKSGLLWSTPGQMESQTLSLISAPAHLKRLSQAAIIRSRIFSINNFDRSFAKLLNP